MNTYQHWVCEKDDEGILWLHLDCHNQSVNTLNSAVMSELDAILDEIIADSPKGVVITSAKKKGFIAGADVKEFSQFSSQDEAFDLIRSGQLVFDKLASLSVPTVAMINGFCLGGGYELALACRYRVALKDDKTKIGLPEVKLGIHPGWGGCVRLPALIGPMAAMGIILPGSAVSAHRAVKLGMIDSAVPLRELKRAARCYALNQAKGYELSFLKKTANTSWVRSLVAKLMHRQLSAKKVNREHYPAPYAVVDLWEKYGVGANAMLNEAKSISSLMMTDTAKHLLRVFFLQTQMKEIKNRSKNKVVRVHVVGAGTMGGDIAAWCALQGCYVTLSDRSAAALAPAMSRANALFKKKLKKPYKVIQAQDRLVPDLEARGVASADIIIEAIFEDLSAKQALFKTIESEVKSEAILATNTSSIPLDSIASALVHPERLVGVHFFNPVAKMPLVEVVRSESTDDDVVSRAASFVVQISRLPLVVKSCPGFLVNRVLMPYLMEAMILLQEGYSAQQIDAAAVKFGMPMGPVALADTVGLDICLSVANNLSDTLGIQTPQKLKDMIDQGHLGVKSGKGFYDYKQGKPVTVTSPSNKKEGQDDITDRLVFSLLNEAVSCLHHQIVDSDEAVDAGIIFGTGFAPFRGGPLCYAKERGVIDIVAKLERFSQQYGERFQPKDGWSTLSSQSYESVEA